MATTNLLAGWIAIVVGLLSGALIGMFFHRDEWLGGYDSWRRRMLRLGHIACVGTGLLNIAFAASVGLVSPPEVSGIASCFFVVGAIAMPLTCGLSAWRKSFRHLFFIPVVSLLIAAGDMLRIALCP